MKPLTLPAMLHACAFALGCVLLFGCQPAARRNDPIAQSLIELQVEAGTGTRTGYVNDDACAICHRAKAESFAHSGMAKAMRSPGAAQTVEGTASISGFDHVTSDMHFELDRSSLPWRFRQWRLSAPEHVFATPIDRVLGSGHRARVYLARNADGSLYQLPIAWYAQSQRLGMAPGFDRPDHDGATRLIRRECVFCHTAYPTLDVGADRHDAPHRFDLPLPDGIGCQRCHGPGEAHVRAALASVSPESIRASITQPARLAREARISVCLQCHLLPAVALAGPRRDGRGDFSFRPGEHLSDYVLHIDINEQGRDPVDRFEINHHGHRLMQSACFRAGLECIDCHDPHQAVTTDTRLAKANDTCARCHTAPQHKANVATTDCLHCHMPKRQTEDVVQVQMTDHRLARTYETPLSTLRERDPQIASIRFIDFDRLDQYSIDLHAGLTFARNGLQSDQARTLLGASLRDATPAQERAIRHALVPTLIAAGALSEAQQTLDGISALSSLPMVHFWLGSIHYAQGDRIHAEQQLRAALRLDPRMIEARLALARLAMDNQAFVNALQELDAALALRANHALAHLLRGQALEHLGRLEEAREARARAAAISPRIHARLAEPSSASTH